VQAILSERRGLVLVLISVNDSIAVSGVFIFTVAVALGSVTLVNAIGSVFPLFLFLIVVIVGTVNPNILREELDKPRLTSKFIAILLMVSGTIAISGVSFN
jgi:hypothetical protein